jgi:hypothetical protein
MKKSANHLTLLIFAPVLILTGVAGFIIPAGLTSGAPPYNTFHIVFGLIGVAVLLAGRERLMEGFNIGFGLIDLYQVLASYTHLFPERFFRWTKADDVIHIILGLALIIIGCYGAASRRRHSIEQHPAR